ncbi:hypothetical protein BTUL_0137g00140 [Botrytis tulipae]|uniref:Uncharacterized protein n=1 Tax=Botrytis tulipae TaxID=87230 RepID=A0A4Z1EMY3_9HELO|nr:hypothetical protein BTUL_0137g00140 [Botrytis tulipae]
MAGLRRTPPINIDVKSEGEIEADENYSRSRLRILRLLKTWKMIQRKKLAAVSKPAPVNVATSSKTRSNFLFLEGRLESTI